MYKKQSINNKLYIIEITSWVVIESWNSLKNLFLANMDTNRQLKLDTACDVTFLLHIIIEITFSKAMWLMYIFCQTNKIK